MKKLMFVLWACLLAAPALLMFSVDSEGGIGTVNILAIVYAAIVCFNFKRLVPRPFKGMIEKITDID